MFIHRLVFQSWSEKILLALGNGIARFITGYGAKNSECFVSDLRWDVAERDRRTVGTEWQRHMEHCFLDAMWLNTQQCDYLPSAQITHPIKRKNGRKEGET